MNVQVIMREGQPEYAVLPWAEYQTLLQGSKGRSEAAVAVAEASAEQPALEKLTRLPALRQALGMSQEDLARCVGISPHYLAMLESGERPVEGAIASALARALGVSGWEGAS